MAFVGHEVTTVHEAGWASLSDGEVLRLARGSCDVFVTIDHGIEHQQNIVNLPFGIVVVKVRKNRLQYYEPLFDRLREAIERVQPGEIEHVGSGIG